MCYWLYIHGRSFGLNNNKNNKEGKRGKGREKEKISEKGLNYKPEVMDHM